MHHWGRTALLALSASLVVAAPASAAKEPFKVNCEGVEYTLTSGNGKWAVAKDTQSKTHFIPVAFTFTVSDSEGDVQFSDSEVKKGHRNQEKITCTFQETFEDEDGQELTFSGTAVVVQKP